MKIIRFFIGSLGLLIAFSSFAQQTPSGDSVSVTKPVEKKLKKKPVSTDKGQSKLIVSGGIGIANYVGDLVKNSTAFSQSSFSTSAGLTYMFIPHLGARFDVGFHNVQGYDSKSGGAYPGRNLSFRSRIIEFSLAAEYDILDMNKSKFVPYVFAGVGAFHFNPSAYYGSGGTRKLRDLGTEGQGLAGYPKLYSKMAVEFPLGLGFKYAITNKIMLQGEFNYRITGTDYLDDVSTFYPSKAVLDARNPETSKFTYRGAGPYPTNPALKRGSADEKDGYYTTQVKIAYKLKSGKGIKKPTDAKVKLPVKPIEIDTDGDGIADASDKCINVKGSKENSGCPWPFVEDANLVAVSADSMTYSIFFDLDRALLLPDAFKTMKGIVAVLNADNALKLNITGHSDITGTDALNMKLSEDRANITRDYLLSYNIPAEKISTSYYGNTMPVDKVQQWRNRRVEVTIIKK